MAVASKNRHLTSGRAPAIWGIGVLKIGALHVFIAKVMLYYQGLSDGWKSKLTFSGCNLDSQSADVVVKFVVIYNFLFGHFLFDIPIVKCARVLFGGSRWFLQEQD